MFKFEKRETSTVWHSLVYRIYEKNVNILKNFELVFQ